MEFILRCWFVQFESLNNWIIFLLKTCSITNGKTKASSQNYSDQKYFNILNPKMLQTCNLFLFSLMLKMQLNSNCISYIYTRNDEAHIVHGMTGLNYLSMPYTYCTTATTQTRSIAQLKVFPEKTGVYTTDIASGLILIPIQWLKTWI